MDAVKFIKERSRMCKSFDNCSYGCPAWGGSCKLNTGTYLECEATKQVEIVEEWSAAHPRKTRQSVFLEHYPDAPRDKDNLLTACPKCLDANVSCVVDKNATVKKFKRCDVCRREFWMQEVE